MSELPTYNEQSTRPKTDSELNELQRRQHEFIGRMSQGANSQDLPKYLHDAYHGKITEMSQTTDQAANTEEDS